MTVFKYQVNNIIYGKGHNPCSSYYTSAYDYHITYRVCIHLLQQHDQYYNRSRRRGIGASNRTNGNQFIIENVYENKLYIRNLGTATIKNDSTSVYIDNKNVNIMPFVDIGSGETGVIEIETAACPLPVAPGEHDIKVSSGIFTAKESGNVRSFSNMCGDGNGDCTINVYDGTAIARYILGYYDQKCLPLPDCLDVDGDGDVDSDDQLMVMQCAGTIIPALDQCLCIGTTCVAATCT
jgi:hypothetical protein